MIENATQIAARGIAYRARKGFTACTWETFPARLCSLFVELDELRDAIERHQGGWPTRYEIADVCLYACTMLGDLVGDQFTLRGSYHGGARRGDSAAAMVLPIQRHALDAHRAWQKGRRNDAVIALELVLVALADLRQRVLALPGTVHDDVDAKIDLMASRETLHGGKHPCT